MSSNPPIGGGGDSNARPEPGTYVIFSRVLSVNGEKLAMTFNGDKQPITVTKLDSWSTKQRVSTSGLVVDLPLLMLTIRLGIVVGDSRL
jgi:hypothetical protein